MTNILPTVREASARIRSGELSSLGLTTQVMARADRLDKKLGTYIARFDKEALKAAQQADNVRKSGKLGPLHGVPIGIKDLISTREGPTTANSLVMDPEWGEGRDAPAVARLRAAGAVITGKLSTSEFATGRVDPQKPFPIPRNPWDLGRWPGGSSAGSANGVAGGLFLAALGTDTSGSVRGPAASCGISGFVATYGCVPKSGVVPLGYSLDRVGTLAWTAEDCAIVMNAIAGHDPGDPTSADRATTDMTSLLNADLKGMKVGVANIQRDFDDTDPAVDECLQKAAAKLAELGAVIKEVELPYFKELSIATSIITTSEGLAYHGEDLRKRWDDYYLTTRDKIAQGIFVSGADYVQAQRVRGLAKRKLADLFKEVDIVLTPTQGFGGLEYDEKGYVNDPTNKMWRLYFTIYWSGAGNPVMSVPMGFTQDNMPLGFQITGRPFDEARVVQVAHAYQQRTDWHRQVAPMIKADK